MNDLAYRRRHDKEWKSAIPVHDHRGRLPIHADSDSSLVDERFGESLYLRVTVKKQDASIYVIVSDMKKSQPPYRIENECTCASIRISQKELQQVRKLQLLL